ncbi:MAG TPA: N-acetylmuramoyl-L-alanine amidase [Candidatus Nanopelagicales bacterium]|nr:N-acetylmuramoyl-L-alanine amidase [Candidatus Nanopelagicales bacterium]
MVGSGRRALLGGSLVAAAALTAACATPTSVAPSPAASIPSASSATPAAVPGAGTAPTSATSAPTGSAAVVPATPAPTAPTTRPPAVAAQGPVPLTWEGGRPVLYAPRWHPTATTTSAWLAAWPRPVRFLPTRTGPLAGVVIALDPGHDIGNGSHVPLINRTYWVGFTKACNTTGTATNSGYAEATYTFDVTARLRRLLTAAGATVVVTRDRNTTSSYGPCIGARGLFGGQEKARLMVQVHADGGPSTGHGFHTIVPASSSLGSTRLTAAADKILAAAMIAGMRSRGFVPATYLSSPLQVRTDQGAMTVSTIPIVTVETLNMRSATDAAVATSATGRQRIALGLYAGILRYLGH